MNIRTESINPFKAVVTGERVLNFVVSAWDYANMQSMEVNG
jgi:hypothetical protein